MHLILALVLLGSGISMMSGIGFVDHRVRDDFLTNTRRRYTHLGRLSTCALHFATCCTTEWFGIHGFLSLSANVDVTLDNFQGCIFGQPVEEIANLFFCRFDASSQLPHGYILLRSGQSRATFQLRFPVDRG